MTVVLLLVVVVVFCSGRQKGGSSSNRGVCVCVFRWRIRGRQNGRDTR